MARGVVSAADGAKKMRAVQVRLLADEVRDDLEHVEPYGFTSEPKDDEQPEAFALFSAAIDLTASCSALLTGAFV